MTPLTLHAFDVVVVPFPFSDSAAAKRRPALVITHTAFNRSSQHCVLAMITSAGQTRWPGDLPISELEATGLTQPCCVRLKLFTLDQRLVLQRIGSLAAADQTALALAWGDMLAV